MKVSSEQRPPREALLTVKLDEATIRYQLVLNEGELPRPPRIQDDAQRDTRGGAGKDEEDS